MPIPRILSGLFLLILALSGCAPKSHEAPEVDAKRLSAAETDAGNWMSYGRTYKEQRYSPLKQIDPRNVEALGLAWYADFPDDGTPRGLEATPLVIDGVLYTTTAYSRVFAFDATTGQALWSYDPKVPKDWVVKACCGPHNRGVAAWKGKIYVGTLDGRLVALDAKSGKPVWSTVTIDPEKPYTITGAPRVVKGKVLIGNGGAEFGVRGYVSAYDAETGALAWRFHTVPGDPSEPFENETMKMAAATWSGEWWTLGGGGTVWDAIVYDPELDLLYIGVGNGTPWDRGLRSAGEGDNLFLSSIVALKPDTGDYVWHYQTTPGDEWDFTATQPIILADLEIGGKPRKVLMQAPKNGFFYVLDRRSGELISAEPFVPVTWAEGVDPSTGRPIVNPAARYSRTGETWIGSPGPLGAHSWHPMAYSPDSGLVYIPANDTTFIYVPDPDWKPSDMGYNVGVSFAAMSMPQDPKIKPQVLAQAKAGAKGYLLAWDPVAQKEVWRVPHASPSNGGVLTTAGQLVAQGNVSGRFELYDALSGETLWSFDAQTAVMGGPISYAVDGEQYIAVTAGRDGVQFLAPGELGIVTGEERTISRLLVFKLGGSAELPPLPPKVEKPLNPPPLEADAATVQHGFELYSRYCGTCHGDAAVSAGVVPDLRYSPYLHGDAFDAVVLDGALAARGMASFAPVFDGADADAVQAYLIQRAHETIAELKAP